MKINKPASAQEADANANAYAPWPPGDYDFIVAEASEEISKASGNEMIKLTLHVFNQDGAKRTVFDYLLSNDKGQWKVRHAAEAIGLLEQYEAGFLDINNIAERSGRLKLRIKPASGEYTASNAVVDYIKADPGSKPAPVMRAGNPAPRGVNVKAPASDLNDEIPF
jgi:hypothetical protein